MNRNNILDRGFFQRETPLVARQLIGTLLVRIINNYRVSGIIYETEAYDGEKDLACHARSGKTDRNAVMYGDGGYAYVYFTYGRHWMVNCVAGLIGYPAAVLIRAIHPIEGLDHIHRQRNPIKEKYWCNGPAKLTKSLSITHELNGVDLCTLGSPLTIESGFFVPEAWLSSTPRVCIQNTPEPWKSKPWRFIADPTKLKSNFNEN
jgi:DNA-3-methyladenine glycosylase